MRNIWIALLLLSVANQLHAQTSELKFKLNEDGSEYFKFTATNQVWVRYTQTNPGTTVFGDPVNNVFDIGIRRLRFQAYGQLTKRVFFYSQFGQNNFTFMQPRFTGAFLHDAIAEYSVAPNRLAIGAGLTGWSGLGRYASPAVATILSLDAPLYQQATNSTSDQFLRKLSIYAKGKIAKLDYRVALSNPMSVQTGNVANATAYDSTQANFSPKYPRLQSQAYVKWEFLDEESNTTPYLAGCYLGKKRIFNIGAGIISQPKAMWSSGTNSKDTQYHTMQLLNVDVFYDAPMNAEKGNAITIYVAASSYNFGPKYLRMIGVMNPANGAGSGKSMNGGGNTFPMIGTGTIYYAQLGYLFGTKTLPKDMRLQLYAGAQLARFTALKDPMLMTEAGVNWYMGKSQNNKITFGYQNRPIYNRNSEGNAVITERKGMFTLQYQVGI